MASRSVTPARYPLTAKSDRSSASTPATVNLSQILEAESGRRVKNTYMEEVSQPCKYALSEWTSTRICLMESRRQDFRVPLGDSTFVSCFRGAAQAPYCESRPKYQRTFAKNRRRDAGDRCHAAYVLDFAFVVAEGEGGILSQCRRRIRRGCAGARMATGHVFFSSCYTTLGNRHMTGCSSGCERVTSRSRVIIVRLM